MSTSLYQAEGRLDMLKQRSKRCLCRYCGGHLEIKSIMFNEFVEARVELYCPHCERIEYGVEPEIYQSAKDFIEVTQYDCFPGLEKNEMTKMMSVSKICDIMAWHDRSLGIVDDDGFCVPIHRNDHIFGECVIFDDEDLQ